MELDVHLTRAGDEPWGFEFSGGADSHQPLTIDQVLPCSPAQTAGLQPGDLVARLGDNLADKLTQEEARAIVAESVATISFGICRGLYDPVLDDYEPIYEPTDRADSDLRSEPTEVYPDLSLDDPNILDPTITDPSLWDSGYATRPVTETRSLTASPFIQNTKPYRSFSTEPLEVPPLDDPIILDPNYKDSFNLNKALDAKDDDLLRILPLDGDVEAKFKLPVSEKYDPDWDKKVKALLEKCTESEKQDSQQIERELACYSGNSDIKISQNTKSAKSIKAVTVQEPGSTKIKVIQEINKHEEISTEKIEQVALEVVEESIERAVSVTEDIQKEIEEERASMVRELKREGCEISSETKERFQESEIIDEKKESEMTVTENEKIKQILAQDQKFVEERRLSTKQEIEETIESGSVKRKSSNFEQQSVDNNISREEITNLVEESISAGTVKVQEEDNKVKKEALYKTFKAEEIVSEHHSKEHKSGRSHETYNSEGKQKAYMIGLQTIPHIKGFVQSSHHFDLLLRTFFIHLTDVMVALSRFILTKPAQELEAKSEKVINEKFVKEFTGQKIEETNESRYQEAKGNIQSVKEERFRGDDLKQKTAIDAAKQEMKIAKLESHQIRDDHKENILQMKHVEKEATKTEYRNVQNYESTQQCSVQAVESTKKSGAEMAQRTQKKSKDLTRKMDAVITEFETKTGKDDRLSITDQRRRSRSRSQVEEDVMRESDPLEWLDKVDSRSASQERSDVVIEKGSSSYSASKESKRFETKHESRTTKVKPGKQMYVAVVESHVYTNKDAISEDLAAEISETASVQSSEEINGVEESFEAVSSENVVMNNYIQTEEKQQAVEVISNALQEVVQEKQEVFETVNDFKSQTTKQHSKFVMQESHTSVATESTEIISESKAESFDPAKTVQEDICKTTAIESFDMSLESTKEIVINTETNKQEAVATQSLLSLVAVETTEIIDESNVQSFETKEVISTEAIVSSEDNFKTAAENISEVILEAVKEETTELKLKEQQAVAKVESLAIAVAESTDVVVDDSKVIKLDTDVLVSKKAEIKSEETYKTAAVGISEVTFETAEEKHSDVTKTSEVTIKKEAEHLSVAGIIETKTELCKEPKKPAEDEYASLKIIKHQTIDADESEDVLIQSELNVKKSLEINTSTSHFEASQTSSQSIKEASLSMQNVASSVHETLSSVQESSSSVEKMSSAIQEQSISTLAISSQDVKSLRIDTNLAYEVTEGDENNNTPTPLPPTPLTDEYVFKLEFPLPKNQGTVIVEDSPDREDPHIVKKGLVPHIETTIEDQIIYDPPLPTPPEEKPQPVYTKPGLKGGAAAVNKKEYIREIERKSSLLASAIDETIKSIEEYKEEVGIDNEVTFKLPSRGKITNGLTNGHENGLSSEDGKENSQELSNDKCQNGVSETEGAKESELPGFKPVVFNPEAYQAKLFEEVVKGSEPAPVQVKLYVDESGEPLGTVQGIVDGLEDATVDEEVAKELGKPGMTEDKIAELISGESEMLREAHVMGLTRVLTSHMTRPDDSSVDFQKIKPLYDSLKDSEVLKALNEEIKRECELKKKKDEKKWTTFLQKPKRPVPRAKFGYIGNMETEEVDDEEPYKVKIVKQPKPKVAPDYKPEDFDTGPLPWEQRALAEPVPSPVPPEEPILVPEEAEFFEAVDPLPESEVPDLEDTGLPLPPTPPPAIPTDVTESETQVELEVTVRSEDQVATEAPVEPEVQIEPEAPDASFDMDQNAMAQQLVNSVKSMLDPKASLEQQLCQMRAQLSALAQLPCVIQQSLELLTRQLAAMGRQETHQVTYQEQTAMESRQEISENSMTTIQEHQEISQNGQDDTAQEAQDTVTIEEVQEDTPTVTAEEYAAMKREQDAEIEEQRRSEKDKKDRQELVRLDQESRQVKQRAPRVGKPRPVFGPLSPEERPVVLPGGRRWRGPKDAYNEQFIAETIQAQSEIIQGKVMGINFMKYEKPPVNLDHLQNSATYKLVHNLEDAPLKRTALLTPVVCEADYRERCRSATPAMQTNGRA